MTLFLYVLRQQLVSFTFALAGVAFLVLPSIAVQAVHKLGGVSLEAVAKYIPMSLVELVPFLLPMAFLLSIVAVFGRLAADRELIAVHMARFHPARLVLPGLLVGLVLAGVTYFLTAEFSPRMKYQRRAYLAEMKEDVLELFGSGGNEFNGDRFSLRWDAYDEPTRTFDRVLISTRTEDGDDVTVQADRATVLADPGHLTFRLEQATTVFGSMRVSVEQPTIRVPLESKAKLSREKAKYQASSELEERLAAGGLEPEREREYRYEVHSRRALAAIYLLFVLLGVPTGVALKSGTQLAALCVAVGYALVYYLVAIRLGKGLSEAGTVSPALAAWATNALFALSGLVASWRVLLR